MLPGRLKNTYHGNFRNVLLLTSVARTFGARLCNARVHDNITVFIADKSASTEEIRIYISKLCRTYSGIKITARFLKAVTKITVIKVSSAIWITIIFFI
jgi:hypothetical protein